VRIGVVEKIDGPVLTVKAEDGQSVAVQLRPAERCDRFLHAR
jgi:hypothetical protein